MKAILEGLLFISGDEGLSLNDIANILDIEETETKALLKELFNEYQTQSRGFTIEFLGEHYKLTTKPEHKEYYQKLVTEEKSKNLSNSSLEVLCIIAYNEPISRTRIDEIRGVNSSYILRKLLLLGLIEEKGRSEMAGRPILYGVTKQFLDYFGLGSIDELPKIQPTEFNEDNNDLFNTKYHEQ